LNHPITAEVRPIEGGPGIDLSMFAATVPASGPVPAPIEDEDYYLHLTLEDIERQDEIDAENRRQWEDKAHRRGLWRASPAASIPTIDDEASAVDLLDTVEIGPEAEAEWSGFSIGVQGIAGDPPAHQPADERAAWTRGHAAGFKAYEEAEMDHWADEMERQDAIATPFEELVEGAGVDFARSFGR
jgi:hypothetical protein